MWRVADGWVEERVDKGGGIGKVLLGAVSGGAGWREEVRDGGWFVGGVGGERRDGREGGRWCGGLVVVGVVEAGTGD